MVLYTNDMFVFVNMLKFVLTEFNVVSKAVKLIRFRQHVIIAVITLFAHHTFALPVNTGHSLNYHYYYFKFLYSATYKIVSMRFTNKI